MIAVHNTSEFNAYSETSEKVGELFSRRNSGRDA
jgi:hypothetical protein